MFLFNGFFIVATESPTFKWSYDVFLSFRCEDTRTNFTGHLDMTLRQKGVNVFIDDNRAVGMDNDGSENAFHAYVERETGEKLKCIRTDNEASLTQPSTQIEGEIQNEQFFNTDESSKQIGTEDNIQEKEPESYEEAIEDEHKREWNDAMKDEMESLHANHTFELVKLPKGKTALKNNQKKGIDFDVIFAPVVKMSSMRVVLDKEKDNMCKVPYALAVRSLMYVTVSTRPDIAHVVGVLTFGDGKLVLVGYTDSDMAGDLDSRKSTSGYLMTFVGGAVSRQSRLQKCVALSTTSRSAIHLGKNATFHSKTNHIDVRYHWLRDALNDELFELEKIHTDCNESDMLTKNLPRTKLEFCRSIVGMTSSSSK
ncbi:Retrovirus-related Pol polyprotein from transposon TNT 1-94 [Cucumis melo var. makuwa]|uniref:Retrovirus-related Pol polyprotein from transposon TNT 1-94 n=1 Tax=Cucumis melo var. makuwa TaxID=1194695 RepID=A0A5D3D434_CUCMM|nr:Retrovirus-related Pol polyprotein from transposon TNT 1-94 [Cucumis melo var. makuwa]